jgi:hypothetical protein
VGAARVCITQKGNLTVLIGKQDVFYGVPPFLATILRFLLIVIVGARDWSVSAVVKKRASVSVSLV